MQMCVQPYVAASGWQCVKRGRGNVQLIPDAAHVDYCVVTGFYLEDSVDVCDHVITAPSGPAKRQISGWILSIPSFGRVPERGIRVTSQGSILSLFVVTHYTYW